MIEAVTQNRAVDIRLRRNNQGVKVMVRVVPEVEEFFKRWGGGIAEAPTFGRLWKGLPDEKLLVWSYDGGRMADGQQYSLSHTGGSFFTENGHVNLSFLRLIGASDGREFMLDTVMSKPELDRIGARLVRASEQFYVDFIQPVDLNIYVAVRDLYAERT